MLNFFFFWSFFGHIDFNNYFVLTSMINRILFTNLVKTKKSHYFSLRVVFLNKAKYNTFY